MRAIQKSWRRRWSWRLFISYVIVLLLGYSVYRNSVRQPEVLRDSAVTFVSAHGDATLLVTASSDSSASPRIYHVRMIGVLPTRVAAAQEWLHRLCAGCDLRLEFDKRKLDSDGATLAYVYKENLFLNAELLRLDFAAYQPYPGDSTPHAKLLRAAAK